jgi:multiple antibiotic resistance protein
MTETLHEAFILLLVMLNPLSVVPIYLSLTQNHDAAAARRAAIQAPMIACGTLVVFGIGGHYLLQGLGLQLSSLRIAGGILLFLIALDMVFSKPPQADAKGGAPADITVFPLAIPMISGPGAITTVMLVRAQFSDPVDQAMVMGIVIGLMVLIGVALLASRPLMKVLGATGMNVITRILGILMAALGAEFVIVGVRESFKLA